MRLGLSKFVFLEKEIIFCLIVKTKQLCEDKSNDLCQEPFDKGLSIRHSGSIRRSDELKVSTSVGINHPLSYLLSRPLFTILMHTCISTGDSSASSVFSKVYFSKCVQHLLSFCLQSLQVYFVWTTNAGSGFQGMLCPTFVF